MGKENSVGRVSILNKVLANIKHVEPEAPGSSAYFSWVDYANDLISITNQGSGSIWHSIQYSSETNFRRVIPETPHHLPDWATDSWFKL